MNNRNITITNILKLLTDASSQLSKLIRENKPKLKNEHYTTIDRVLKQLNKDIVIPLQEIEKK